MTGPHGIKPAPGPDQPPVPVRLVTFNTHHGVGEDSRHDLPRLAKVLASVDADVICLQEVDRYFGDRSEDVDQALLLSRALDMQLAWGPAIDEPRPGDLPPRQYGNALLSRLPILVSDVHRLPGGGEPRSALRTMLELDGSTLWVTATHLTTRSAQERSAQVAALAALHTEDMAAGVLVGDFNAPPAAPELGPLRERFTDAWELAPERGDQAGWRFWQRDEGHTHPARAPHRRIDQAWVSAGVGVAGAQVLDADGASDHLPFMVDLQVPSGV
ncbi:endonuclease/exonuclease/phosphatase family protein [Blastococcus haudaquaticus]|uniref:Metal-dependent hydrolase, endonuclease/exonuclease/phosphatase family n=1 Tax=Blastococcus haudaquaticus TaxID=1938745 RepID=A0A286GBW4_9ACTN|nr:endonuclease/exonuclease/phosphatase family protein [Blastococcus haudaquaticus]SOD93000.1 Metal-dependent hydrolase, endonuclease/exonuclease/phosphatase family [Blastococcus haudaquaticus]